MVIVQWCGPYRGNYFIKYRSRLHAYIDIEWYKRQKTQAKPIAIFAEKPPALPAPVGKYEDQAR